MQIENERTIWNQRGAREKTNNEKKTEEMNVIHLLLVFFFVASIMI